MKGITCMDLHRILAELMIIIVPQIYRQQVIYEGHLLFGLFPSIHACYTHLQKKDTCCPESAEHRTKYKKWGELESLIFSKVKRE